MSGAGTPVLNESGLAEYYVDASGAAIYDGKASYQHWKIFVLFLFMKVEDYADEDQAVLSARTT